MKNFLAEAQSTQRREERLILFSAPSATLRETVLRRSR
jgi:hypothetical protein